MFPNIYFYRIVFNDKSSNALEALDLIDVLCLLLLLKYSIVVLHCVLSDFWTLPY